jgi:hypothetical protein
MIFFVVADVVVVGIIGVMILVMAVMIAVVGT